MITTKRDAANRAREAVARLRVQIRHEERVAQNAANALRELHAQLPEAMRACVEAEKRANAAEAEENRLKAASLYRNTPLMVTLAARTLSDPLYGDAARRYEEAYRGHEGF